MAEKVRVRSMNGKHAVRVEEPHVKSLAALVLLHRGLEKQQLAEWLAFREEVLDEAEARDGKLICAYCHRDDLVREVPDNVRKPANLATIDHVVPRSKGGGEKDKSNCVVACLPCNQRKADKDEDDFE